MKQSEQKKLSSIIDESLQIFRQEFSQLGIKTNVQLRYDFSFNDSVSISKLLQDSIFKSICNVRFVEDKWISIYGEYSESKQKYTLTLSDSKAEVKNEDPGGMVSRISSFFTKTEILEDQVFYDYQKSQFSFASRDGEVQPYTERELCLKPF